MADYTVYCPWNDWEILTLIGNGHFGKVYKAVRHGVHTGDEFAAIKIIKASSENVDAVINEINTLRELRNCPNILYIEDYKVIDNNDGYNIYIRTALLTSLTDYRKSHNITEQDVIQIGIELCNALIVCHRKNIIHRDIKPSNILYNRDNNSFYLCDFGIAKKFDKSSKYRIIAGTPSYIAPEVYSGIYTKKADIYSLGLVLYFLMNDFCLPFTGKKEDTKSVREHYKQLSPPINSSIELSHIILKACAFEAVERFETAEDLKNALIELKNGTYDISNDAPTIQAEINTPVKENNYQHYGESITKPLDTSSSFKSLGEGSSQTVPLSNIIDDPIRYYNNNVYNKSNELPKDADNWDTFLPGEEATQPIEMLNSDMQSHNSQEKKRKLKISSVIIASLVILLLVLLIILLSVIKNSSFKNNSKVNSKPHEEEPLTEDITVDEITTDNSQEIENAISSIIDNVEALSNKNNYEEALGKINEGLKDYPDSEKLQQKKEILEKQIATVHDNETAINEAKELADNNKLVEAIHRIEGAISNSEKNNVSDDSLSKTMNDYTTAYVKQVSDQANELISNTKYDDAIKIVSDALIELPENNALSAKKSQIENEKKKFELAAKKEQVFMEAEEAFNSQGYEQAIKILQSVPELSSDPDIKAKIAEYQEYKPISLFALDYFDSDGKVYGPSDPQDNLGNRHPNSYEIHTSGYGDAYVTYRVDGKYNHLRGTFFLLYDYRSSKSERRFRVYNDDNEIIYTATITHAVDPVDFDIDISGVKNLKLEFSTDCTEFNAFWARDCAFSNVTISK